MSIVICKLPKAGLGNQLFPLMHAFVFAKLNGLPVIVTGYHRFKPGPYLRHEKSKRRYNGYFNFQKNLIGEYIDLWRIKKYKKKYTSFHEPKIEKLEKSALHHKLFIFEKMPTYHDYFERLKDYREDVIHILYSILNPALRRRIERLVKPVIGVHIRMGDFRKLKEESLITGDM